MGVPFSSSVASSYLSQEHLRRPHFPTRPHLRSWGLGPQHVNLRVRIQLTTEPSSPVRQVSPSEV